MSVAKTYWSKDVSTIVTNGPFAVKTFNYDVGEFTLARNLGYHQDPSVKDYDDKVRPAELVSIIDAEVSISNVFFIVPPAVKTSPVYPIKRWNPD